MLFELDLRVRVLQVGTSALKPCHDIVLKGLKINSWRCAHYEIGARVGESGGRTAKNELKWENELHHGKSTSFWRLRRIECPAGPILVLLEEGTVGGSGPRLTTQSQLGILSSRVEAATVKRILLY